MLTLEEKINILNSYSKLRKTLIKPGRINYYYDQAKTRRKVIVRELWHTGNGYVFAGYLNEYKNEVDTRGFISIDKFINNENEFRTLIEKVIASFE